MKEISVIKVLLFWKKREKGKGKRAHEITIASFMILFFDLTLRRVNVEQTYNSQLFSPFFIS